MCVYQKCHDYESCGGYRGENIFFHQFDTVGEQALVMTSQDEDLLLDSLEQAEAEMKADKSFENMMSSQDDPILLQGLDDINS